MFNWSLPELRKTKTGLSLASSSITAEATDMERSESTLSATIAGAYGRDLLVFVGERLHDAIRHVYRFAVRRAGAMRFEPALVAAQALLDPLGRRVEGRQGVLPLAGGLQGKAGVEMDHAVGVESRSLLLDRHMSREPAVEIFGNRVSDALLDAPAERIADFHLFARNSQVH